MSVASSANAVPESTEARNVGSTAASALADLPAAEGLARHRELPPPPDARERPVVVVVDDEPHVLSSIYNLLRMDYQVVTFERGTAALEFLRAHDRVPVILSDQRMPEMSGVEVLRAAAAIRPETTRLLITAHTDVHTVIDAINQGHIFRYLSKPCEPDLLAVVVRQAVEHHNLIVEKKRLMAELQETNARLMEANRLKAAFIEVASHELNTPITVVLGMIELWRMSHGGAGSALERQWVDRIGAAALRLARTVERMLKLVRNRDFSQSLEKESIELGPVIARAIEEVSPYLELRRQQVTLSLEPGLGTIEADPSKIADVLVNLLANAVKFTPDGGTIRVEALTEPSTPGWVRVNVTDQGVGVSLADQQHLFEPFFTGFDILCHSSGEYQFGKRGIGLGLWLVKTFVELHGGRVTVCSTPGVGSTFAFSLPRSQPASPSATSAQPATHPPGARDDPAGLAWPTGV
jgi:signal transduction histidine kinase